MQDEGIYNVEKRFQDAIRRLNDSPNISDEDKLTVSRFIKHMSAKGIGRHRQIKYLNHLIPLALLYGKPFKEMTKDDAESLISDINQSVDYTDRSKKREHPYSDATKRDYKVILKKYMQFVRGYDEDEKEYPRRSSGSRRVRSHGECCRKPFLLSTT